MESRFLDLDPPTCKSTPGTNFARIGWKKPSEASFPGHLGRFSDSFESSRLGGWASRFGAWASRFGVWASRFVGWSSTFGAWASRFGTWASRFRGWASRIGRQKWAGLRGLDAKNESFKLKRRSPAQGGDNRGDNTIKPRSPDPSVPKQPKLTLWVTGLGVVAFARKGGLGFEVLAQNSRC